MPEYWFHAHYDFSQRSAAGEPTLGWVFAAGRAESTSTLGRLAGDSLQRPLPVGIRSRRNRKQLSAGGRGVLRGIYRGLTVGGCGLTAGAGHEHQAVIVADV